MKKIAVNPENIHPPFANYSHGLLVNESTTQLFISGQLGASIQEEIPSDFEAQANLCFDAIDQILKTSCMNRNNTVKISTYLTHQKYLVPYMKIRDNWIRDLVPPPASTLLIISGFSRPEFKIEIEAHALG